MVWSNKERGESGWLLELQEPIYNYVLRTVQDTDLAGDLTQEVFAKALERSPKIPRERLRPWLFGVAAKTVLRHFRDNQRRRRREERVARENSISGDSTDLEAREREEIVHRELGALPVEQRSLLMLHYFGDLNQTQMADALGIPRTTLGDRLGFAREALKLRLRQCGHLALLPGVGDILRNTRSVPVPVAVSAEINAMVAISSTSSVTIAGGFIMTKKILGAVLIVFVASLTGGIVMGRLSVDTEPGEHAAERALALEEQQEAWKVEKKKLLRAARDKTEEIGRLTTERSELASQVAELEAKSAAMVAKATSEADVDARFDAIDWTDLRRVIANNMDAFIAMTASIRRGEGSVTRVAPKHQSSFQELMVKWNRAGAQAREETPYPFLEPELFPTLVDVMFRDTIGLTDSQIDSLTRQGLEGLSENPLPEGATPLEAYLVRGQVVDGMLSRLSDSMNEAQTERWDSIAPVFEGILRGDHRAAHIGLADKGQARTRVMEEWKRFYSFDPSAHPELTPISERYLEGANAVLARYGQTSQRPQPLDPVRKRQMNDEFYEIQLEIEREILDLLDEEGLRRLRQHYPVVIRFGNYVGFNGDTRVTGGL